MALELMELSCGGGVEDVPHLWSLMQLVWWWMGRELFEDSPHVYSLCAQMAGTPGTGQACVPYSLQSVWFGLPYSMVVSGWLDVSMAANFFWSENFKKTRWNLPAQNSHFVTSAVLSWSKPQASLIQRGRRKDSVSCWKKGILRQGGKELMQPSWKQATTYFHKLHTCISITLAGALHFKQVHLEILKCTTFWESV